MGFVIAIAAGLNAENGAARILITAMICMAACYLVGALVGAIAEHAVRAHLIRVRSENPVPEPSPAVVAEQARSG